MENKRKHRHIWAALLCLAALWLAGCGGQATPESSPAVSSSPTPAPAVSPTPVPMPSPSPTPAPSPEPDPIKEMSAMEFAAVLGNGINIGNSLDAYGKGYDYGDHMSSETLWGNPAIDRELFVQIREMGLQTVRIPVSWTEHTGEDFTVKAEWMERVAQVVDEALDEGLCVILNVHHEDWLNLKTDRAEELETLLRRLWEQIAARFADYPLTLVFEGMNEPRLKDSEEEWTVGTPELRELTNRLNRAFVDTVRASGGSNAARFLLVTPYCAQVGTEAIDALEIPDERCMVSVHLYYPYDFCLLNSGATAWQEAWRSDLDGIFRALEQRLCEKGVTVIVTEFGCIDKGNTRERVLWTQAFAETARAHRIGCVWWDDGGDYRLLDRSENAWEFPEIAGQLLF